MIYKTIIRNSSGQDMMRMSGVSNHPFNISNGDFIVIPSRDEYALFARYEEIIFLKGKSTYTRQPGSNVVTETIADGGLKLKIRKNWQEPKRQFPTISFLNEGGAYMELYFPDCFSLGEKLYLPKGIPVFSSVPVYSPLAKFRELVIHKEEIVPGAIGDDLFVNHELKGKRPEQELQRLAKMLNDWKESEKNRIKVL